MSALSDIIPVTRLDVLGRRVAQATEDERPMIERWLRANIAIHTACGEAQQREAVVEWRAARDALRYREDMRREQEANESSERSRALKA